MPELTIQEIEAIAGIPMEDRCNCCLKPWEVFYQHKYGTNGKLCVPCFVKYRSFLGIKMYASMRKSFRKKECRQHYVSLIRTQEV